MEDGLSWEANTSSPSQTIRRTVLNPEVHCRIHKSPPPVPTPSQINPVHVPPSRLLNMHFIIILSSAPRSSKWSLSFRFFHQNPIYTSRLSHSCHMPHPPHSYWFDYQNNDTRYCNGYSGSVYVLKRKFTEYIQKRLNWLLYFLLISKSD